MRQAVSWESGQGSGMHARARIVQAAHLVRMQPTLASYSVLGVLLLLLAPAWTLQLHGCTSRGRSGVWQQDLALTTR